MIASNSVQIMILPWTIALVFSGLMGTELELALLAAIAYELAVVFNLAIPTARRWCSPIPY